MYWTGIYYYENSEEEENEEEGEKEAEEDEEEDEKEGDKERGGGGYVTYINQSMVGHLPTALEPEDAHGAGLLR